MRDLLIVTLLLGLATYRVGRYIVLDDIFNEPRQAVHDLLLRRDRLWRSKLSELLACPYCVTVWVALFATLFWALLLTDWPGWWFPVVWHAAATVAIMIWVRVDPE